jgi:hypothetical protein
MCWGKLGSVWAVDVVCCPGVVGSWALAADPAVGGVVSDVFGSGGVVASVVGSCGVADCFGLGLAGGAAGGVGGEGAAGEAGALDGHGVSCWGWVGVGWGRVGGM